MKKLKIVLYFDTFEQAAELGHSDAKQNKKTKRWRKKIKVNHGEDYYIESGDGLYMESYEI